MTIIEQIYSLIVNNSLKKDSGINFEQNMNRLLDLLENKEDLFKNIPSHPNKDRVFFAAVRLGNTVAVKAILKYFKDKNIHINFKAQAEHEASRCKWNLLQYVCIAGNMEMMRACFRFIGDDKDKEVIKRIKDVLQAPIEYESKNEFGERASYESTIGELMAVRLDHSSLAEYLSMSLTTSTTCKEHKKAEVINFLRGIGTSAKHENSGITQSDERDFISKFNIINTGSPQLFYLLSNGYINVDEFSTRTNLTLAQLVDGLAMDYHKVENDWNTAFRQLLLDTQKFKFMEVSANPNGTACLRVQLLKDRFNNKIEPPIDLNITIDYRELNRLVQKKHQELQDKQRNRGGSIDRLKEQMSYIVENRKRAYLSGDASDAEKTCFSVLFENTQNYLLARQIASTTLFTANTVTRNAQLARTAQDVLSLALKASPINAEAFTMLSGMCVKYVTEQHSKKQTKGVLEATVTIDMPNALVDLTELMTKMIVEVHKYATDSEIAIIAKKISTAINGEVDRIYKLPEINEASVREALLTKAIEALGKIPVNVSKKGPSILHRKESSDVNPGASTSGSEVSSQKKGRSNGRCSIS